MSFELLVGDQNQCPTCKEYFNSVHAFDKHRKGKHGIDRHCLTIPEMLAKGMDKNAEGFWIGSKMDIARQAWGSKRASEE